MSDPSEPFTILAIEGDIDLYQVPVVKGKLDEVIQRKAGRILVDLSRVNYIDSSGLALFIESLQTISAYGGKLGLFGLQPSIRHIFEIACLDRVLQTFPDEATARSAL